MKKGLTLLELIVVIAIIAILATIILGNMGGSLESARAAGCLSNMKKLASASQQAANNGALGTLSYPLAGSKETFDALGGGKYRYTDRETRGWISWYSKDVYPFVGDSTSSKASKAMTVSMYETDDMRREYALTNGAVWRYVGCNRNAYLCPSHVNVKRSLDPLFTYTMNAYFRWSENPGEDCEVTSAGGNRVTDPNRAERKLLFAEIQFVDDDKLNLKSIDRGGDLYDTDAILQFYGCTDTGKDWSNPSVDLSDSYNESIGFNHKTGKRRCANLVFMDGHVEKLLWPDDGLSDSERRMLTQWLCRGLDVSFDGKAYKKLEN